MCLMSTPCLAESVRERGGGLCKPWTLEDPRREGPPRRCWGSMAWVPGSFQSFAALPGPHHSLQAEGQESLQGSRLALALAGAWVQRGFAVINEIIVKMHLSQSRSGGGRWKAWRCAEPGRGAGVTLADRTLALVHPREA